MAARPSIARVDDQFGGQRPIPSPVFNEEVTPVLPIRATMVYNTDKKTVGESSSACTKVVPRVGANLERRLPPCVYLHGA